MSEFLGVYLLVLTIGSNAVVPTAGNPKYFQFFSNASVLMVMTYAVGNVSGAHLNPCMTLCIRMLDRISNIEALFYVLAQFLGACLGGVSYLVMFSKAHTLHPETYHGVEFSIWHALAIEAIYTCLLVFVWLNVCCASINCPNQFFGVAVAFVLLAGGFCGQWISGGMFNPAVAFGIDIASFSYGVGWCFAYMAAELLGGLMAFSFFRICRPEEFGRRQVEYESGGKLFAELLGTFYLVFTALLNRSSPFQPMGPLSTACCYVCLIYSLSSLSGAHLNPAITLAVLVTGRKKIAGGEAVSYIVMQTMGAVLAALLAWAFIFHIPVCPEGEPAEDCWSLYCGPKGQYTWISVTIVETMFTFSLAFTFLNTATVRDPLQNFYGLAIGFAVIAGSYGGQHVSGGTLNPAISIGTDVLHKFRTGHKFGNAMWYASFQVAGAVAAAFAFATARPVEYAKGYVRRFTVPTPQQEYAAAEEEKERLTA